MKIISPTISQTISANVLINARNNLTFYAVRANYNCP